MPRLQIMDTTIRDGQQSLWATRMQIGDMLPILPKMDRVGYWAIEAWGGATFDTCLRFLDENPWERLRSIKANTPNTPLSMLSRGQNLVGYKHYSREICNRFIKAANRNGIHVFRVFDALNDIRNVVDNADAIKECGAHFEGAISYTISPVHTLDSFLDYGQQLKDLGLNGHVQSRRGLIADKDLRVAGHSNGDDDALAHTARELVGILLEAHFRVGDADIPQVLEGLLPGGSALEALMELHGLHDLVADGLQGVQAGHGVLHDHGDLVAADFQPVLLLFQLGEPDGLVVVGTEVVDGAGSDGAVGVQQAHEGLGEHALA